ncbi:MAG: response regulator [Pseudomonadota bacterium]|nr:response regulator [Pseudomonadota bacterium]
MAHILIAEDDDAMRRFLALALSRADHEVFAVSNGPDALDAVRSDKFDLMVIDIIMPGLDGIELALTATGEQPMLKILFITGFAAMATGRHSPLPPGSGLISKPFHLSDLVDRVTELLA